MKEVIPLSCAKPEFCQRCPINHLTTGYVPPQAVASPFVIVGEAAGENEVEKGLPFVGGAGAWLDSMLKAAKLNRKDYNIVNVLGCRPPDNVFPGDAEWKHTSGAVAQQAVDYCAQHHLLPFLKSRKWDKVIALGGKALEATTGMSRITQWRGSPLPLLWDRKGPNIVLPTLHPAALMRQATMFSVAVTDLNKSTVLPPEHYKLYPTLDEVKRFDATEFAFDFEWEPSTGRITMCGLTDRPFHCLVVPFEQPYIEELRRIFTNAKRIIGHNIVGADTKYFEELGWQVSAELHDTMLMQHLVQPDMRHGLNFVASVFTNKVYWKGHGDESEDENGDGIGGTGAQWKTWSDPNGIPVDRGGYTGCRSSDEAFRLYNARDTDASYQCWLQLRNLITRYGLEHTYWNVSVPIAHVCRELSNAGLRLDTTRLGEIIADLTEKIKTAEALLPESLRPYEEDIMQNAPAPEGTYKPKKKVCKGSRNTPHDPLPIVFEYPGEHFICDICGKGFDSGKMELAKIVKVPAKRWVRPLNSPAKVMEYAESVGCLIKTSLKTKKATADKNARKGWAKTHPEFIVMSEVVKQSKLKSTFATEALLLEKRMYFRLNPVGTTEGRFSSAGQRKGIDYNIQNVPKSVRKIFVVDEPGQAFLNLDVMQGENMITAHLAKDVERLERLMTPGYSEHADLASRIFGLTVDKNLEAHEHYYKAGKITNHGRNYGLGVEKMRESFLADGIDFSIADIKEFIEIWKKMNRRTAEWQKETIAVASRQGFLENVYGRRRWFQSRDYATKALAFLPASTLADTVMRMMLAHYPGRFLTELMANKVDTVAELCDGWRMCIQVHDSIGLVGPAETWQEQARRTTTIMTQPWAALDGFTLGVDLEVALPTAERPLPAWGDCKKVKL